jgi:uncharacterized protein YeaO (DUF488 family)
MVKIKRVYAPKEQQDGKRFLVERLWPRGIKKDSLPMEAWLKEIAPSNELRRWFSHDPEKWRKFKQRYWAELDEQADIIGSLREAAHRRTITLLYSARNEDYNNAVALKEYLEKG